MSSIALSLLLILALLCHHTAARAPKSFLSKSSMPSIQRRGGAVQSKTSVVEQSSNPEPPPLALTSAHWMTATECLDSLSVSEASGLSSEEASRRLRYYGENVLSEARAKSLLQLFVEQFQDRLVQILLSVATFSALIAAVEKDYHAAIETSVILAILVLNAIVGIVQTKSAENSLEALKKLQPTTCSVLRDGQWLSSFPTALLVPGDVIYLRVGDKVPADARIIYLKTNTFSVDEGSLTGESVSVMKSVEALQPEPDAGRLGGLDGSSYSVPITAKSNTVFAGTLVTAGVSCAVVVGTGANTEIGLINSGVQEAKSEEMKTPLAEKLDEFGNAIAKAISVICVIVWLSAVPKFGHKMFSSRIQGAIHYAKVAVALGVAAIPEGLPAVITLCLSLGAKRMARRNVIVRKLSSIETLGCTTVICTDKTGTLTTNQMAVTSLFTFASSSLLAQRTSKAKVLRKDSVELLERGVEGVSYEPVGAIESFNENTMRSPTLQIVAVISALCNEAKLEFRDGVFGHVGEPTEAALKVLAEKLGLPSPQRTSQATDGDVSRCSDYWASKFVCLSILEFSRDRKSMSVLVRPLTSAGSVPSSPESSGKIHNMLLVKGAAELLLERCSRIMLEDGSILPITADLRHALELEVRAMAKRPLRCLALAYKYGDALGELNRLRDSESAAECKLLKNPAAYADLESDLTLVGICGIKDPARPEAGDAIHKCREAGIRVMMITGDSKETAVSIAKEVNIFTQDDDVSRNAFTSKEFFSLPADEQLNLLRQGNKVFCRTEPRDKQRLITMLERLGEIPAMTGDGVNDAPALQQAAIGIAMGRTGTEVAKSAASMILTDDNFCSIVGAVEEGRNIFNNMQAFICFLVSCNIGEIVSIFLASVLGLPEPLTPLHLLWVNLVTDGSPASALGFNPPDPAIMSRRPRAKDKPLLSPGLFARYLITGTYVGFATIGALVWWFLDQGVTFKQLCRWDQCLEWGDDFAHSLEAPRWPDKPCNIFQAAALQQPQTLSLTVLVMIELFKALSAVSLEHSIVTTPPWKNPWLLLGVSVPLVLHLSIMYIPLFSRIFSLHPLSGKEWQVSH